jgi:hypothetical protein
MTDRQNVTVRGVSATADATADAGKVPRFAKGEWLFDGYRKALARFRDAESEHDEPQQTFVALFETLSWASSLGDWLQKRRHGTLPHFAALDWIRDRVLHQWADAIEVRPLYAGPIRSSRSGPRPGPFFYWHWLEISEIPAPDAKFESPAGEAAYDNELAGQRVLDALEDVERFLERFR